MTKYETKSSWKNRPGQNARKNKQLIQMEWAKTTIAINNPRVKIPEYPTQNNKQFRW